MKENKVIAQLRHKKDNVNVDLTKLYPNTPSANSPLKKGWQPKVDGVFADTPLQKGNYEVKFKDGTKNDTKDLDYKLIKSLIWWE